MSRITVAAARSAIRSRRPAACRVIGLILLGAQRAGQAADPLPGDALAYANGYLVTGNYVEASVDFQPASGGNGFGTGTINVSGVPDQADVLAAWLYWETIVETPDQRAGVQFGPAPRRRP